MNHVVGALLALSLIACGGRLVDAVDVPADGGDATADTGAMDAGGSFDAGTSPGEDASACNTVAQLGAPVPIESIDKDYASNSQVGPPVEGSYTLESATYYAGAAGAVGTLATVAVTIRVLPLSRWEVVSSSANGPDARIDYSVTPFTPEGPYKMAATCGAGLTQTVSFAPYQSTGYAFALVIPDPNAQSHVLFEVFRRLKN